METRKDDQESVPVSSSQEGAISIRMEACDACGMDVKGDGVVYCTTCAAMREPAGPSPEGAGSSELRAAVQHQLVALDSIAYQPGPSVLLSRERFDRVREVLRLVIEAAEAREGGAAKEQNVRERWEACAAALREIYVLCGHHDRPMAPAEIVLAVRDRVRPVDPVEGAAALRSLIEKDEDDTRRDGLPASGPTGSSRPQPKGSER